MKRFKLTLTTPGGGLMVGGYNDPTLGLHGMQARTLGKNLLNMPLPLIPATALRGAMRETLEAILRGAELSACSGGNGLTPEQTQANVAATPCLLDPMNGGRPCVACRLLGTRQAAVPRHAQNFSGLLLSDARLSSALSSERVPWIRRPGVSIQRKTRSAENQRIFIHEVIQSRELQYEAEVKLLDDSLEYALNAAVAGTTHLGAGRSRGLGRISMTLTPLPEAPPASLEQWKHLDDRDQTLFVSLTLTSPAFIGEAITHSQLSESRHEIPGSTLRGAVGFALARQVKDTPEYPAFQQLVSEKGAQFGFLWPVSAESVNPQRLDVAPYPITAASCKYHRQAHGVVDQLLDVIAHQLTETAEETLRVTQTALTSCRICRKQSTSTSSPAGAPDACVSPLKSVAGTRMRACHARLHTITRGAMDRMRSSHLDEALFTRRLLVEGQTFEGTIRNIPPETLPLLLRGLASLDGIGRGISHGWGRVQVTPLHVPALAPLPARAKAFDEALQQRLSRVKMKAGLKQCLIPFTLLSPYLGPGPHGLEDDGEKAILSKLQQVVPEATCFLKRRRFTREGLWTQWQPAESVAPPQSTGMHTMRATRAGAVFVMALPSDTHRSKALPILAQLEQHGIGERTCQGFGQLVIYDPFILQREQQQEETVPEQSNIDKIRPKLVTEAEGVMKRLFQAGRPNLQKTQLNQLVNVCGTATSREEIENYLRYQAGRGGDRTGWSIELVRDVLQAFKTALLAGGSTAQEQAEVVKYWRDFATFMTRAYTWEAEVQKQTSRSESAPNSNRNERRG